MNERQIELVQASFNQVLPISQTAGELFYGRLFELDPSLRLMFRGDMNEQIHKLMSMLKVVVTSLTRLDAILSAVKALGARHVGYGVVDSHYDTVASALLWTLEKGLGDAFTDEVREAWIEVYMLLTGVMKDAAAQAQQAPERMLVMAGPTTGILL
ncbi:MAG: globin family protein [Chloroflexia bacterium]|jgi:hemoglobin-like flavoprotein